MSYRLLVTLVIQSWRAVCDRGAFLGSVAIPLIAMIGGYSFTPDIFASEISQMVFCEYATIAAVWFVPGFAAVIYLLCFEDARGLETLDFGQRVTFMHRHWAACAVAIVASEWVILILVAGAGIGAAATAGVEWASFVRWSLALNLVVGGAVVVLQVVGLVQKLTRSLMASGAIGVAVGVVAVNYSAVLSAFDGGWLAGLLLVPVPDLAWSTEVALTYAYAGSAAPWLLLLQVVGGFAVQVIALAVGVHVVPLSRKYLQRRGRVRLR